MIDSALPHVVEHPVPGARLDDARPARGRFHDVVLLPGVAAVRIARRAAAELPRRVELTRRLTALALADVPPALVHGEPDHVVERCTAGVVAFLERALPDHGLHPCDQVRW